MKRITKLMTIMLVTGMLGLPLTSLVSAKETIEVRKAGGGQYSYQLLAYDGLRRSYYNLSGAMSSNAHKILIPKGWASTMTVYGPRHSSGYRNFYQQKDETNPILEVRKGSEFVLELVRVGYLPRTMSSSPNSILPNSILPKSFSPNQPFERQPPQ